MLKPHFCLQRIRKNLIPSHRSGLILWMTLWVLFLAGCSVDEEGPTDTASKSIPQSIVVTAGTRAVSLDWGGVVGASGYTVYWSNQAGVTQRNGVAVSTDMPTWEHIGLSNGVRYYYVITSRNVSGESSASREVSAVPYAAVPVAVTGVQAQAGDGRVSLRWQNVAGASRYSVYWRNTTGVSDSDNRIDNAVSPLVHSGLINGDTYYYVVLAENAQGAGLASIEVQAQPIEPTPAAPVISNAIVNIDSVELYWQDVSAGAGRRNEYDLYWNNTGNVTVTDAKISGVTSPYRHTPLSLDQKYYYRVQARSGGGVSQLSNSVQVQPPNTMAIDPAQAAPAVPEIGSIELGNQQLSLNWLAVNGASGYNLYWTDSATELLTQSNPAVFKISNIQSPYTHIQLNNGTTYRYALSAINNGGESGLSAEKSTVPQIVKPGVPVGLYADGSDETISVRWLAVDQADTYVVYVTEVSTGTEQPINPVVSPLTLDTSMLSSGLINGAIYRIEVSSVNNGIISDRSLAVEATPNEPPPLAPSQLTAEPGAGQVLLRWKPSKVQTPADPDEIVTGYQVYYSTFKGVSPLNGTLIPALNVSGQPNYVAVTDGVGNPVWELSHSGLTNGQRYYYSVTAQNVGGESRPSESVWARPQVRVESMPNNIWADAGDDKVVLNFNEALQGNVLSYNLYWNKEIPAETSSAARSTTEVITNIVPGYVFRDGADSNGNTYYFRLSTVNAGGESALSSEVSASPQIPAPQSAPQNVLAIAQQSQVSLSWTPVTNATAYVLYWSTEAAIDPSTSARIMLADQSTYIHSELTNGLAIYYQLAAVNAGGEGALSSLKVAMPQQNVPVKPNNVVVTAGDARVLVNWPMVATASSYTLYWDTEPVDADVSNWSSMSAQSGIWVPGLTNGQSYQFQLVATNAGGNSLPSNGVNTTPELTPPASPLNLSIASGETQLSLNWTTQLNENYTLYWTTDPNQTTLPINSGNQIDNVRPTYVHIGLTNGSRYRYQLTASHRDPVTGNNVGTASAPSTIISAIPATIIPAAPQALRALAGESDVSLSWLPPVTGSGPLSYTLYWSNTANQGKSGNPIANLSSASYTHRGLSNSQTYYYIVTATATTGIESDESLSASASPQGQTPGQVIGAWVAPGNGTNVLHWQADAQSSQYLVEWSKQVDANNALQGSINSSVVVAPNVQFQHSGLTNGDSIYYRIVAQNNKGAGGSLQNGLASSTVSGTPQSGSNQAPQIQQGSLVTVTMDEDSSPGAFALVLNAIDNDGDSLNWTIDSTGSKGMPGIIVATNSAAITYIPLPDDNGRDQFKVVVSDGNGGSDRITIDVVINAQNDAPVFNNVIRDLVTQGTQTNVDGATVSVDASASDIDSINLVYSATGLPPGLSIDSNTGEITGVVSNTASLGSPYSVTLLVDDQDPTSKLTDNLVLSWAITTLSMDPSTSTVSILPSTATIEAGATVTITVSARDANNDPIATGGASVQLTITGPNAAGPLPATDNNNGTYSITYVATSAGMDSYTLALQQGVNFTPINGSYNKTITPGAANAANSLAQIPAGAYTAGAAVNMGVLVKDAFGNSTAAVVAIVITGNNPQSLTVNNDALGSYSSTYTPTQVGSDVIAISVDGANIFASPFTRSINASTASAANSVATIPAGPYTAGQAVTLAAQVNDNSGNATVGFVSFDIIDAAANTTSLTGVAQGGGLYQISYTPTLAGTATIISSVDGSEITLVNAVTIPVGGVSRTVGPDVAEVTNSVVLITPAEPVAAGNTVTLALSVVDVYSNPTTATSVVMSVSGANLQAQPLIISNPSLGQYTASYPALKSGIDTFNIIVNNVAFTTQLTLVISAGAASVITSSATVNPLNPVAGDTVTIAVQARDVNANLTAAVLDIEVTAGSANAQLLTSTISNPSVGLYDVSYIASNSGQDMFLISIDTAPLDTNSLTRTIAPANTAPIDITLTNSSIAEGSANGTVIATLAANDTAGDTFVYRFIAPNNDANGRFSIMGNTLQVANGTLLDFETSTEHFISIQVTDQGSLTFIKNFTITLTDVNDVTPVITNLALTPSIPENSTLVVALTIDDVDTVNGPFVFTLTGFDAAHFEVVANNLQFITSSTPDYEIPADVGLDNTYDVNVSVSDGVNSSVGTLFAVSITNVVEAAKIYYVKKTALNDSGDGLSVATAKKTIPAAIAAASTPSTIQVSLGTYFVNSDTRNASQTHIVIKDGVSLYGGYTLDFSKRLPTAQVTIIEDISTEVSGSEGLTSRAIEIGGGINSATVIDGFTIRGSASKLADYTSAINLDPLTGLERMGPTIQNNIIFGGNGSINSMGIRSRNSSPIIEYNKINGGSGSQRSLGITATFLRVSSANIITIQNNSILGGSGGNANGTSIGILSSNSIATIRNNKIVAGCAANCAFSAGINNQLISGGTIENNVIHAGIAARFSRGILNSNSYLTIRNNFIYGGSGGEISYGIENFDQGNGASGLSLEIHNNVIHGGVGTTSIGIQNADQAKPNIRNNIIDGGSGTVNAYGIRNTNTTVGPVVENNLVSTSATVGAFCILEQGANPLSQAMHNNSLFSCGTAAYFDTAGGCGAGTSSNCTVAQMQTELLADFSNGASANIAVDPLFMDKDGHDNDISTLEDNDWRFSGSSPMSVTSGGLNAIDNGGWGYTVDKDGAPRPVTGTPWSMGAYDTTRTYYVNSGGAFDGDGLSVVTAAKTIAVALAVAKAPAIIRVSEGTYPVNSAPNGQTQIKLKEGVSLLGGHTRSFATRDANLYISNLMDVSIEQVADINSPPSRALEAGAGITPATVVEGFTITGSTQAGVTYTSAIVLNGGSPTIRNNIIDGGLAASLSYGIQILGSSQAVIENNVIRAPVGGGNSRGISNSGATIIRKNSIQGEQAIWNDGLPGFEISNNTIQGGTYGIVNNTVFGTIRNNTINVDKSFGIYNVSYTMPIIENNIIQSVQATSSYCIYVVPAVPRTNPSSLKNNNLYGCSAAFFDPDANCGRNFDGDNNATSCSVADFEGDVAFGLGNATGNISVAPLFVNPVNDWHLTPTSPINVRQGGLNIIAEVPPHDKDGNFRTAITNGLPSNNGAAGWSMGAYELD